MKEQDKGKKKENRKATSPYYGLRNTQTCRWSFVSTAHYELVLTLWLKCVHYEHRTLQSPQSPLPAKHAGLFGVFFVWDGTGQVASNSLYWSSFWNLLQSSCLCLPSVRITSVSHHIWLDMYAGNVDLTSISPHPFPEGNYTREQAITYVVSSSIKLFIVLRK